MANNPKIKVGADLSEAEKAVDDLGKKLVDASKPIDVKVDTGGATKAIDDLADAMERVDEAGSLPGAKAGARQLQDELEKARRIQAVLAKEGIKASREQANAAREAFAKWRDSGARGTRKMRGHDLESYIAGGWRETALDEREAARGRSAVLRAVGLGPEGGGGGGGAPGRRSLLGFAGSAAGMAGRGLASSVLPHGGVGGSILNHGMVEAAGAGGLTTGAGMGRLAVAGGIGALAFGAIKLAGAVARNVSAAEEEGTNRSDMLRSIGGATDEFDRLRKSTGDLATGLNVTAAEATSLAKAYATGSGVTQNERGRVYGEAGQAGSFARDMGLDVGSTVGQMAELRRNGQEAPKRIGVALVDAMSKKGDFGRLAEATANLTSFVSGSTAASGLKANTDGILDLASRLASLGMPGLGTAEGIGRMASMDAGFRGGAGGDAGNMALLDAFRHQGMNLTGYDVQSVREAGLMARVSDVFGRESAQSKAAQASGNTAELSRLDRLAGQAGNGTVLDSLYANLKGRYRNQGELASAMQGVTGGGLSDVRALVSAMESGGVAGITGKLGAIGVNASSMSAAQLVQASGVLGANNDDLEQRRADMLKRNDLTPQERQSVGSAVGPDELRKALVKVAASETTQTDGEKTRGSLNSIQRVIEDLSAKLVPAVVTMRDLLITGAEKLGWINREDAERIKGVDENQALARDKKALSSLPEKASAPWYAADGSGLHMAAQQELDNKRAALQKSIQEREAKIAAASAANGAGGPLDASAAARADASGRDRRVASLASAPSQYDDLFAAAAKANGVSAADLKLIAAGESGMRADARNTNTNGTSDLGLMQHNSRYLAERGLTPSSAMDPKKSINAGAALWASLLKKHGGNRREAFRAYNGSGPAAEAYADARMRQSAMLGANASDQVEAQAPQSERAPVPFAAAAGAGSRNAQDSAHSVSITLRDPNGAVRAKVPTIKLSSGAPVPAGTDTWEAM